MDVLLHVRGRALALSGSDDLCSVQWRVHKRGDLCTCAAHGCMYMQPCVHTCASAYMRERERERVIAAAQLHQQQQCVHA